MSIARDQPALTVWRAAAAITVILVIACTVAGLRLDALAPADPADGTGSAASGTIPGLAMALPGALLMWRLGGHPIAVILTGFGVLWGLDGVAAGILNVAIAGDEVTPLARAAFWYYARFGAILLLPILLILLLFPDGRLPKGGWRGAAVLSLALASILPFAFIFAPAQVLAADEPGRAEQLARFDPGLPTLPLPDALWSVILAAAFPSAAAGAAVALAVTVSRRRGASAEQRSQLRWLIFAGVIFVALLLMSQIMPSELGDVLFALGIAFVSAAIVIAVARYGLYAIDRLLSWTIVYAVLFASVVLVDVALYVLVGSLFDDRAVLLIALLAVLAVYTPLRDRLFRLVTRWVNGSRDDPYEVLSTLANRLEAAGDTQTRLDELSACIARAFASSFVRVELERPEGPPLVAQTGAPTPSAITLPLTHEGSEIGRIRMQPGRRPALSARDRTLLSDLVRLAAAALLNAELSRELQGIRVDLVSAREEERSRLRRELHDGLGPLLGGIRLRLETSRNLIERQPEQSLAALDAAIEESSEVVAEIRRLVHDLRPPALDDLGLVRAIEQQAERLTGGGLHITLQAEELPPLSAALEVAAYRIASEAMTNASRHSGGEHVVVRIKAQDNDLIIEVDDDGVGMASQAVAGVGLVSLRARAAELGGSVAFEAVEQGADRPGTRVHARLPLRRLDFSEAAIDQGAASAADKEDTRARH
ncbi:histidine kinase [Salinibacterium sp. SYSU T00001]|uniref:sensor histidine kinase n=1 Tax=Homoserinimonas sedimenticola TaxID=2986805 RepID=UPI0022362108|nr:histidine kinase [Salinibacterium sedimenticola]MCW4384538.1 histidine kinase [Salinibacterium sedimenticola]